MTEPVPRETTPAPRDLFSGWFDDWPFGRWPELWRTRLLESAGPVMRVEEFEEDGTVVVRAEMPGLDPEKDIDISVADQSLRIRAERRQESKVEEKGRYRTEFQYGSFSRTLSLPAGATEKDVIATYKDGILEVRIPVDQGQAEARRIPVQKG